MHAATLMTTFLFRWLMTNFPILVVGEVLWLVEPRNSVIPPPEQIVPLLVPGLVFASISCWYRLLPVAHRKAGIWGSMLLMWIGLFGLTAYMLSISGMGGLIVLEILFPVFLVSTCINTVFIARDRRLLGGSLWKDAMTPLQGVPTYFLFLVLCIVGFFVLKMTWE